MVQVTRSVLRLRLYIEGSMLRDGTRHAGSPFQNPNPRSPPAAPDHHRKPTPVLAEVSPSTPTPNRPWAPAAYSLAGAPAYQQQPFPYRAPCRQCVCGHVTPAGTQGVGVLVSGSHSLQCEDTPLAE